MGSQRRIALLNAVNAISEPSVQSLETLAGVALKSDIIKNIPILGFAVGIIKSSKSLQDYILIRKIANFLIALETNSVDDDLLEEGIQNIERNSGQEALLNLINEAKGEKIAKALAMLLKAHAVRKITSEEFKQAADVLTLLSYEQLRRFLMLEIKPYEPGELGSLNSVGLYEIMYDSPEVSVWDNSDPDVNEKYQSEVDGGVILMTPTHEGQILKENIDLNNLT